MKKTGDLYILEGGFVLYFFSFGSGPFLCIFWWPTRSSYQISHKNSSWDPKSKKTLKNGHFRPFLAIFDGFWDFSPNVAIIHLFFFFFSFSFFAATMSWRISTNFQQILTNVKQISTNFLRNIDEHRLVLMDWVSDEFRHFVDENIFLNKLGK